ncbi:hypothetical protein [Desulfospira joergensenii]|uniref:hypothetical protein n=1 Tax=Desulfospira joergensenii TaxID=53329 RepID=UPI0003B434AB|nr:hypothetical protein [Desulfospira joergensenii]
MNEFILVKFHETREVIINGTASGYSTGEVIEVEAGTHTISLTGETNFTPSAQDETPSGTSPIQPLMVNFLRV